MDFFAIVALLETHRVNFVLYMMWFLFTNLEVSLIHLFVLLCSNWESIRNIGKCTVMLLKLSANGKLLEDCGNFSECIPLSVTGVNEDYFKQVFEEMEGGETKSCPRILVGSRTESYEHFPNYTSFFRTH